MEKIIETAIADDNTRYEFVFETKPKAGASKNVYKSPKGDDYVIGFYKKPLTDEDLQRLRSITDAYRIRLLFQEGGDYWRELFCWPEKIVHWNGQTGILLPHFNQHFYFQMDNRLKGHEKIGKWFTSAKNLASSQVSVMPFIVAGLFYYIMNGVIEIIMNRAEKNMNYYS